MLALSATGVAGDYNQYRSEVLRGDPARAVSILTVDVMQALRQEVKISRPPPLQTLQTWHTYVIPYHLSQSVWDAEKSVYMLRVCRAGTL